MIPNYLLKARTIIEKNQNEKIFYLTGPNGEIFRVPESRKQAFMEMLQQKEKEHSKKDGIFGTRIAKEKGIPRRTPVKDVLFFYNLL